MVNRKPTGGDVVDVNIFHVGPRVVHERKHVRLVLLLLLLLVVLLMLVLLLLLLLVLLLLEL